MVRGRYHCAHPALDGSLSIGSWPQRSVPAGLDFLRASPTTHGQPPRPPSGNFAEYGVTLCRAGGDDRREDTRTAFGSIPWVDSSSSADVVDQSRPWRRTASQTPVIRGLLWQWSLNATQATRKSCTAAGGRLSRTEPRSWWERLGHWDQRLRSVGSDFHARRTRRRRRTPDDLGGRRQIQRRLHPRRRQGRRQRSAWAASVRRRPAPDRRRADRPGRGKSHLLLTTSRRAGV
jgi:hypothetical protein